MSGLQQSISRTSAHSFHSCFTNIEKKMKGISNMVRNYQINATYDPNNSKGTKILLDFAHNAKSPATQ